MQDLQEIWKPILEWENLYEVSNKGRVRSKERIVNQLNKHGGYQDMIYPSKILKGEVTKGGYIRVTLQNQDRVKRYSIHRLVASHFIPNPHNLPIINHINENPSDNNVTNLEWCTHKYNHSYSNVGLKCSKKTRNCKERSIPVYAINDETGVKIYFPSINEAERFGFNNIHKSLKSDHLVYGFKFYYDR